MNTSIRNLDAGLYRSIKARASLEGRALGEVVNDAFRLYLLRPEPEEKSLSIIDLQPFDFVSENVR